jgi:hypothetical protein
LCRLKCSGLCTLIGVEEKPGGREKANRGKKEREGKRERKKRIKGKEKERETKKKEDASGQYGFVYVHRFRRRYFLGELKYPPHNK